MTRVAYCLGEVLLARVPFPDGSGVKKRPVLVVHDPGDADVLVVPVTSHPPRTAEDLALNDWAGAGLRLPSTARLSKLATLGKATIFRPMGRLISSDERNARAILERFFATVLR
jgi:hypothetical protein